MSSGHVAAAGVLVCSGLCGSVLTDVWCPVCAQIDGGMQRNIYDSMAEGVMKAGCVVCFMEESYEKSENCRC
eukprot:SAG22_NODE_242_length_14104_cov_13.581935_2_plen_72_part_00